MPETKTAPLPTETLPESEWKDDFLKAANEAIGLKFAKTRRGLFSANIRGALAGATVAETVAETKGENVPVIRIGVMPEKLHFLDPTIIDQPAQNLEEQLQRQEAAKKARKILKNIWQELTGQEAVIQIVEDENATFEAPSPYAPREEVLTSR